MPWSTQLCCQLAWPPTSSFCWYQLSGAVPPLKLTTVANQPGFPGCRPTDVERSARRRDFSRIVSHLPSATSPVYQIIFLIIPLTGLHLTSLTSEPSSSLHYLGQFKNVGSVEWLIYWLQAYEMQLNTCLSRTEVWPWHFLLIIIVEMVDGESNSIIYCAGFNVSEFNVSVAELGATWRTHSTSCRHVLRSAAH